jgi:hypothetical protein
MENLLSHVQTVLAMTAAHWSSMIETIPDELLARPPAPGEWSALECLQHLVDTEQMVFPLRVQAFLDGQDFPAFDPATQGRKWAPGTPPQTMSEEFLRLRTSSLTLVARLVSGDLARKARHAELGPVTLSEMLNEWAAHDLMHLVQAQRAVMQPFIAACGPWRSYFADHDIDARK